MPTVDQVLEAIHGALREFKMEIPSLNSIISTQLTSPKLSCVNFAGAVLERINKEPQEWPSSQYIYPSGLFLNFTLMGDPSEYNHGFCVYFHQNVAYVIQAFLDHKIRLITPMSVHAFVASVVKLKSGRRDDVAAGYKEISSVDISNANYVLNTMYVCKA
ncbi:hypothetical protein [Dyella thiooxydans]|uniref:hypothetical protein n=1 Tax=Dyella thiooxydans TaxID=445710 RepID=UPI0012FC95AB|nr:hypothetical protein [Dyella thiooxydans]